jgi:hypothetical protein
MIGTVSGNQTVLKFIKELVKLILIALRCEEYNVIDNQGRNTFKSLTFGFIIINGSQFTIAFSLF